LYNQLSSGTVLKKGQTIRLKPGEAFTSAPVPTNMAAAIKAAAPVADSKKIHEVQSKEGLYSIAKKYNLSIEEIKQWNQLTSDDLKVGQQLIISK